MANTTNAKKPGTAPQAAEQKELEEQHYRMPLVKINFIIMAVAALMIVVGFVLISGGGAEGTEFNPEVFSSVRLVVGPTLSFLGFVAMGVGIMWPGKQK